MTSAIPGTPLDRARAGLDACVHCGFCLPACPTYLALEDENDSPRGRLVLMGALLDGRLSLTDEALQHIDQCLGCRGCETACPSGVPYGALLEATRETLAARRPLPLRARFVLAVFAREWLLRPALALARLARGLGLARLGARVLPQGLAMPAAMLAATARPAGARPGIARPGASNQPREPRDPGRPPPTRGSAALLTGCVMEGLLAPVNRATERALEANGWQLRDAPGQRCCGALHAHAGDAEAARELARANIVAFERSGAETVVMNSAGCGSMCKDYGHLLADDADWAPRAAAFAARVKDVHELLAVVVGSDESDEVARPLLVAWDAPCHLQHAQRVTAPPLAVLQSIPGLTLVPLVDSDQCCGSAGIFTLVQPTVSASVLAPKLVRIAESGCEVVATANPGCLMQIGGGLILSGSKVTARHPVELLNLRPARPAR
ncbi:MAG TPA: heterodisulfide reductase-related iron-sulfur binding cluster [Gemmatimonadaceae bacterium]|nr:heterodisulfide reductase-related iron-sulfur binding cluster [Gemmatimonadaceae bacterium]